MRLRGCHLAAPASKEVKRLPGGDGAPHASGRVRIIDPLDRSVRGVDDRLFNAVLRQQARLRFERRSCQPCEFGQRVAAD